MTHSVSDQRARAELIAELYDRHAAGLFAYCLDQLGDADSAADSVAAVLAGVPAVEPPRAALYALARREIYRRDVVQASLYVDPTVDPASALVERVLHELRPHQREVLLLGVVCGLTVDELAWVLDVASDTAADLAESADHRFAQALGHALASTGRAPGPVADVYGALAVAPTRDVLARLPWRPPPASLRARLNAGISPRAAAAAARLVAPVKPLWPTAPSWPLPDAPADPATATGLHPVPPPPGGALPTASADPFGLPTSSADPFGLPGGAATTGGDPFPADPRASLPPEPGRSRHEATTEPMPTLDRAASRFAQGLPTLRPSTPPATGSLFTPSSQAAPLFTPAPAAEPARPSGPAPAPESARPATPDLAPRSAPLFTPAPTSPSAPLFTPAPASPSAPLFTPPASPSAPLFTPAASPSAPLFTPAAGSAPLFTPASEPAQRVTPLSDTGPLFSPLSDTGPLFTPLSDTGPLFTPSALNDTGPMPASRPAPLSAPLPADILDPVVFDPLALPGATSPPPEAAAPPEATTPGDLFTPAAKRSRVAEPVYLMPLPAVPAPRAPGTEAQDEAPEEITDVFAVIDLPPEPDPEPGAAPAASASPATSRPRGGARRSRRKLKPIKVGERHYDWAWEVIGLVVALAIAMIVFFAVPGIITP
ncbi:hypothetical protein Misp01_13230 [Microtetraspora sp. NBRC 13810]|uniref:RNA polymerase sigma factor n=1 Tax=Microtetraspora sp. NBRC 13810 TaxID=3030990 RepID=UPI0024A1E188|nr:hypothetical protein [Microtetraspora sp. NBRC 13810]GLW06193.1 hypothetical protein Misp01_13230 [Microtetraspora sp. NBRC 13810]